MRTKSKTLLSTIVLLALLVGTALAAPADFVRTWGWGVDTGANAFEICTPASLPCQAGISGAGAGQFDAPAGVALDGAGNVYVAERYNYRIQQFDGSGNFVRAWGWGVDTGANAFEVCTPASLPCQAGISGAEAGQFNNPTGVEVDGAGNVYVADLNNYRIQQFDSNAAFVRTWGWGVDTGVNAFEVCTSASLPCQAGIPGSGAGQFNFTYDVAVDGAGNVYTPSYGNHRIQQFDSSAAFVRTWGWGVDTGANTFEVCTPASLPCQAGRAGAGAGQFNGSPGVTVDGAGNVYVADHNYRIQQFDSSAAFVRTWGWGVDTGANVFEICTPASLPCRRGTRGGGAGQFDDPVGMALDGAGNVYVAGYDNPRIQQFDSGGNFVRTWGWGVDTGANAFEVCTPTSLPCQVGIGGGGGGQFDHPFDVEVDGAGNVYVAGYDNPRIQVFEGEASTGITIDGLDTGDWGSIPASITDPAGDETGGNDGQDITEVYAAYGDNDAYFRIDTVDTPAQAQIDFFVDNDTNTCAHGTGHGSGNVYDLHVQLIYSGGWLIQARQCSGGTWGSFSSVGSVAVVDIVEYSVPLATFGSTDSVSFFVRYGTTTDYAPDGDAATLVELVSFSAEQQAGGVQVAWETASEVDNAGFNLYRSDGGGYAKLNAALIPAQGGPTFGASYAYDDVEVVPGTIYVYMLEDVDLCGQATMHGPVSVKVGEMPTAVEVSGLRTGSRAAWLPAFVLVFGAVGLAWTWRRKRH